MYNCPVCNTPFETGTKFCTKCGCNLEESFIIDPVCPVCNKTYPSGYMYCSIDGTKLVSQDKLIPRCVICGTQYSADIRYCPKDGGLVIPEALKYAGNTSRQTNTNVILNKASLENRFAAALLDGLICIGLSIPSIIFYLIGLAQIDHDYYGDTHLGDAPMFFFFALIFYFIPLIYSFIKDGFANGQSWGKRVIGLKVVNIVDKSNCTKGTSAIRALIGLLLNFIPFVGWLIEPIMVLATSDGRRLADKAAGTMVVDIK